MSNLGVADRHFNSTYTSSYDSKTNTGVGSLNIGGVRGNLFANPQTDPVRTSSVSVLNIGAPGAASISLARPIDGVYIVGGTHPSALAIVNGPSQTALYVADANEDQLAVVDARADRLVKKVPLPLPVPGLLEGRAFGLQPNALAVSPDNNRLFVAEAGLNSVAVLDVSQPFNPQFLGRIPTGWYPVGVTISADGRFLYVTNSKGLGSAYGFQGAVPKSPDVNLMFGTIQKIDLQSMNLRAASEQVDGNTFQAGAAAHVDVLQQVAPNIKHIFFILRENKTYDVYFGADQVLNQRGANGEPRYANFDAQVPNTKAIAEQFAIGDNVYADSEESNAGHMFALAAITTDYMQKTLLSRSSRPFINTKNEDPEDYPLVGYIFNHLARHNISYRNYGDMMRLSGYDDGKATDPCADDPYPGCVTKTYTYTNVTAPTVGLGGLYTEDVPALAVLGDNHTDPNYPGWNLRISDQRRAKEFIRDMQDLIKANAAPRFTYVWLPNDHTGGGLDPRFQVADNDVALGQMVEFITHSPFWPNSVIFISEDDAQGSPDHVNAHRSYTMVLSPYAKHAYVSHHLSSTVSIPKTIEELLGIPPMSLFDLIANDLSDYFTTTPDLTPFNALPMGKVSAAAPEALRIARLTRELEHGTYDRDTVRLGQLTAIFLNSQELAERAATMTPEQYQAAQSQLYAIACSIVAGEDCLADK